MKTYPLFKPTVLALALLGMAKPASAMTLMEAVDAAIARSPAVESSHHTAQVFNAREEITGRSILPQVGIDAAVGGENSNLLGRGTANQLRREAGGTLTQRLVDWHETDRNVEAAHLRAVAAAQDITQATERVAFESAQAYLVALRANKLLTVANQNLRMHKWLVAVARERVAQGVLASSRLTELEAREAPLEVELLDIGADRDKALAALSAMVGDPGALMDPPPLPDPLGISRFAEANDFLSAELESLHPLIIRSTSLQAAAAKGVDAAKLGSLPTIDADLSTRYLGEAEGITGTQWDNQALLRLRWGIWGQAQPAQIREAEETLLASKADREQARRDIEVDVRQSWLALAAMRQKYAIYQGYEKTAKQAMSTGLEYFQRTTRFATDMLALADLINVRFHASANVAGSGIDARIAELRMIESLGRLAPTLRRAYEPQQPAMQAPAMQAPAMQQPAPQQPVAAPTSPPYMAPAAMPFVPATPQPAAPTPQATIAPVPNPAPIATPHYEPLTGPTPVPGIMPMIFPKTP